MRNGFLTQLGVVQNDYGYDLSFMLEDSAGEELDINGASLQFILQPTGDYDIQTGGAMAIVNASQGQCKYTVQQGDFPASGQWAAQIQVTFATGEILTFTGIVVTVDPELPLS